MTHPVTKAMDFLVFEIGQPIDRVSAMPMSDIILWAMRAFRYRDRQRRG